jgi:cyclophilin family peptidyl-prolyl cis-trans isomerase
MAINNVYKESPSCGLRFYHLKACIPFSASVRIVSWVTLILVIVAIHTLVFNNNNPEQQPIRKEELMIRSGRIHNLHRPASIEATLEEDSWTERAKVVEEYQNKALQIKALKQQTAREVTIQCPYRSLSDLTVDQKMPNAASERHMVAPPQGGKISLICCQTTKGTLTIVAHHNWAPLGSRRFLEMVTSGYFNSGVPMMRCVKDFLCQFGLNASKEKRKDFDKTIEDDPNWLPEGPTHRENALGVKRFAQGYLAYAGSGKHSRNKQFIVALKPNGPLAGGSPWEVPWGELVGDESFQTLSQIYTGYGENGPKQGMLHNNGMTDEMKWMFPELDYINHCQLLDDHDYGDTVRT